jgi:hypothetical protein
MAAVVDAALGAASIGVGQWWVIERAAIYLLWGINGFAP